MVLVRDEKLNLYTVMLLPKPARKTDLWKIFANGAKKLVSMKMNLSSSSSLLLLLLLVLVLNKITQVFTSKGLKDLGLKCRQRNKN